MKVNKNDSMGERMKEYESVPKNFLTRRILVICRLDGVAFHTFCKRFERPFDIVFNDVMNNVMVSLCSRIQGVKMAQRHSDEISLLITDYDAITTDAFFAYNIQKIISVVSGMASSERCKQLIIKENERMDIFNSSVNTKEELETRTEFQKRFNKKILSMDEKWPCFDCRCFNIPENEIANYFYWRLLDCKRNSISMLAQSKFSHKELQGKSCEEMQEMLFSKFGINWAKIPQEQKSGFVCYKEKRTKQVEDGPMKGQWFDRSVWAKYPSPSTKLKLDELVKEILEGNTTILEMNNIPSVFLEMNNIPSV
jgi:tRNA(His) guanylyltransferase